MPLCLLGLGSNLGDRSRLLDEALVRLAGSRPPEISVVRWSRYHETRAVGVTRPPSRPISMPSQSWRRPLSPQTLFAELQATEIALGRQRAEPWGPRTIDLDLLLYDRLVLAEPLEPDYSSPPHGVAAVCPGTGGRGRRGNASSGHWLDHCPTAGPSQHNTLVFGDRGGNRGRKDRSGGRSGGKNGGQLLAEQFDSARLDVFYHDPSSHAWQIELEFSSNGLANWPRATDVDPARPANRGRLLVRAIAGVRQRLAFCRSMAGLPGPL